MAVWAGNNLGLEIRGREGLATPGEKRSWKTGKKGARKKKANPQVLGLFLTLAALGGVLIWMLWPRPMVQSQLFVITPDEIVEFDGQKHPRFEAAYADNQAVSNVFSQLADQVQSIVSARELPVSKLKSISAEEWNGRNKVGIFFVHAQAKAIKAGNDSSQLELQFGSSRQAIKFSDLLDQVKQAEFKETIIMLEISHVSPDMYSGQLALEGVAQLEEELQLFAEAEPDHRLTVITSAAPLTASFPHLVPAAEISGLDEIDPERDVILGTAFGQTVARVFTKGEIGTIDKLTEKLKSEVEDYVSATFRKEQTPQVLSTYQSEKPVDIFRENHTLVLKESEDKEEDEEANSELEKEEVEVAGEADKTPIEEFIALREQMNSLVNGYELTVLTLGDLLQFNRYIADLKYCLDHGKLDAFDQILGQAERLVMQVHSAAKSNSGSSQAEELRQWIPPVPSHKQGTPAFFNELLAEINAGEAQRSPQVVEKLKSEEAREQLLRSFLVACDLLLDEIEIDSPEARMLRAEQVQQWRTFFQRLSKSAGWHDSEWPHQFSIAYDLLRGVNSEWSDAQLGLFLRFMNVRSDGLQFASGWSQDGINRLTQQTFSRIEPQLEKLLIELMAVERWFLVGQPAVDLAEQHLLVAEAVLGAIQNVVEETNDRYDFLTNRRLKLIESLESIALEHNSVLLSADQLDSLTRLSPEDLQRFSATDFPQASLTRDVNRDDVIALLQLTSALTAESSRQEVDQTESAIKRFERIARSDEVLTPVEQYRQPLVHQGIWLGFWTVRCLHTIREDKVNPQLATAWTDFVQSIAEEESVSVIAARCSALGDLIQQEWEDAQADQIVMFDPVTMDSVEKVVSSDLSRHAQLAGSRYVGRYRKIFSSSVSLSNRISVGQPAEQIKLSQGQAKLDLQIPDNSNVHFFPDGVRLLNPSFADEKGWQVGKWDGKSSSVQATSQFEGSASPILAVVDDNGIVQDFQSLPIGVAFQATGWKVRFLSQAIRLPEIDLSDQDKVIKLPARTLEDPLPVTIELVQPQGSFAKSVFVNIAPLKENGELGERLWPQFQELTLDAASKSAVIPLFPPAPEESPNPVQIPAEGLDLTNGLAFIVRPKEDQGEQVEVILKVTPKFSNPLEQYLELGTIEYDSASHRLRVPLRQRPSIPANEFPPEVIGAELNFSRDLIPFSLNLNPPPKIPEITKDYTILEAPFIPEIEEAIRFSETAIGKDRLEFGLSAFGLENLAKWKLGQSDVLQRVGYARSGDENRFGNRTEIRIGMQLANPPEDGIGTHNLDGMFVLAKNWQNAVLDLPLELYGYTAEHAHASLLELTLNKEGASASSPLASLRIVDAYQRRLGVTAEDPAVWLFTIDSQQHGKFGVNLSNSLGVTEGIHTLQATLKDESSGQPIAEYEKKFTIEDSPPEVEWNPDNPKQVLITQDYRGFVSIHDPQTGVSKISAGLGEDSMTAIDLKSNVGEKRALRVPIRIDKSFYPEIEAKNFPIRKPITIIVQAMNSIGMAEQFTEDIVLIQPAATMAPGGEKSGSLLVNMASKSTYDFVLTGGGGKVKRELKGAKATAQFDDLPDGNYTLQWKKTFGGDKGDKSITLKFAKTGEVLEVDL